MLKRDGKVSDRAVAYGCHGGCGESRKEGIIRDG